MYHFAYSPAYLTLLITAILTSVSRNLKEVWVCISWMAEDEEHLFIYYCPFAFYFQSTDCLVYKLVSWSAIWVNGIYIFTSSYILHADRALHSDVSSLCCFLFFQQFCLNFKCMRFFNWKFLFLTLRVWLSNPICQFLGLFSKLIESCI